jgi:pyridoxamine 5'-phosphate oxidase
VIYPSKGYFIAEAGSRHRRKRLCQTLLLRPELLSYSFGSVLIALRYGSWAFGVQRSAACGVWRRFYRREETVCRPRSQPARVVARQRLQFGISSETMQTALDAGELRKEYTLSGLYRKDLSSDPFEQFKLWFAESIQTAGDREPNAMTLATASRTGVPSARVVLLKSFDERGVMFFTNYESRKAQQLAENPHAALNFHWPWLERQIQIEGVVQKVGREESEAYFNKRPLGSRLGAIVSKQSSVIDSRQKLEERLLELKAQNQETNPLMPEFWGGYLLVPERFEFWQGRENRLHDRFLYTAGVDARWQIDRLAP